METSTKFIIGLGAAFMAAIVLTRCESDADKERKPELVDKIVERSLSNCDLQANFPQTASYEKRLREALMEAYSVDLDKIVAADISVCLDQRLSHIEKGFFDKEPYTIFYPGNNPVLTLYDIGKDYATKGWLDDYAASYSGHLIEEFFDSYDVQEIAKMQEGDLQFGYSYLVSTGKSTIRHYKWLDADGYAVFEKNPVINHAPAR